MSANTGPLSRLASLAITLALVVSSITGPVALAGVAGAANSNVVYVTDDGLEVTDASGGALPEDNPFDDSSTVSLPGITLSAPGSGALTIDKRNGTYTNVSSVTATTDVTVNPDDKPDSIVIQSDVTSLSFRTVNFNSRSSTDVVYDAGGSVSLVVRSDITDGATVEAVDTADGSVLASSTADSNGDVAFSDLPSGQTAVSFEVTNLPGSSTPTPTPTPTPGEPDASVSPSPLAFDAVAVDGFTASREIVVNNDGTASLSVTDVSVTGANASLFEVGPTSLTVDPGETESLTVSYDPARVGIHTATVTFDTDDPERPTVTVNVSGTGARADLSVAPSEHDFGSVTRNGVASTTVALVNDGTAPAVVRNVTLRGGDETQFSVGRRSLEVSPDQRRGVTVRYVPTETGSHDTTLVFETGSGSYNVTLEGRAVEPRLGVDPASHDFGSVTVGSQQRLNLTVRNEQTVRVPVANATLGGTRPDQFAIVAGSNVSGLDPGETHTMTVAFRPTREGASQSRLVLVAPDGSTVAAAALNGTASAPRARVVPRSLTFENATVGEALTKNVSVRNRGDGTLRVTGTETIGTARGFDVRADDRFTVPPNGSRPLSVTFTPESRDARTATLAVRTNDPDKPRIPVTLSSTTATVNISLNTTRNETAANVTAQNVSAGTTVSVGVPQDDPDETDSVAVEEVAVTVERGGNFSLKVTESTDPLESSPAFNDTANGEDLGYLSVDHTLGNDNISQATISFRVNESRMQRMQSEPDDMRAYRYVNGSWRSRPTTFVGADNGTYLFRTTAPGLSEWTTAAQVPRINVTDATANVTAGTTGDVVTIDVLLTNEGGSDGLYVTRLLLNGTVVDRKEATVAPNSTSLVFFERSFDQPGEYAVQVNRVFVATVDISAADRSVTVDEPTTTGAGSVGPDGNVTTTEGATTSAGGSLSPVLVVLSTILAGLLGRRL